jgi:hypothetical protein
MNCALCTALAVFGLSGFVAVRIEVVDLVFWTRFEFCFVWTCFARIGVPRAAWKRRSVVVVTVALYRCVKLFVQFVARSLLNHFMNVICADEFLVFCSGSIGFPRVSMPVDLDWEFRFEITVPEKETRF